VAQTKVTIPQQKITPDPIITISLSVSDPETTQAEFELLWQKEYKKIQGKITKLSLLSSSDLMQMLQQALSALQIQGIKPKLLTGKYATYSLSYQQSQKQERVGIVWTEDSNMTTFFHVMNACKNVIHNNSCKTLYLVRAGNVGKPNLAGNQLYRELFTHTHHQHIKPSLTAVHYLATYQSFVNSAKSQELVIGGKTINLQGLESLMRESQILHNKCTLLHDLGLVAATEQDTNGKVRRDYRPVKDFILNLIKTQGFMGVNTLIFQTASQFADVQETEIKMLIDLSCQEKKAKIMNPKSKLQDQLISWNPQL
ncbi:MAG: ATP-binding protein, partial [Sphaerospermopsis kisseleviana]